MSFLPTMQKLQKPLQDMLDAFADGEGPLKKLGDSFELIMETALLPGMKAAPEFIASFVGKLGELSDWLDENKDVLLFFGKTLMWALVGIGTALVVIYAPLGLLLYGLGELFLWLGKIMGIVKKKNSPSFLDLFTGGMLAASFKLASKAIELFFAPIATLGKMLKSLGHMLAETFNFDNIKETIKGFVSWVPRMFGSSVDGLKAEMEISSPSEKMMREVAIPTFVQPLQSVAAKMPGLVDDVYGDVPAMAAKNLKPLTATPQKLQPGLQETRFSNADFDPWGAFTAAFDKAVGITPSPAQAGPQTTQVSIPITIGKEQLGTVVTEIVDGRLGAVSYQGMAGTGGM